MRTYCVSVNRDHYLVNSDHSDETGIQVLMARDGYSIVEYQQNSG